MAAAEATAAGLAVEVEVAVAEEAAASLAVETAAALAAATGWARSSDVVCSHQHKRK